MTQPADDAATAALHKAMFTQLVLLLAGSCMQQLGHPTEPDEPAGLANLEAAQATIDMIDMLEAKTRGHRDPDEERLLHEVLSSLKLAFVRAAPAGPEAEPAASPQAEQQPTSTPPDASASPADPEPDDDNKKRYHKKYG